MPLKAIARHWPEENWALFELILLARIGGRNGRPPKGDHDSSVERCHHFFAQFGRIGRWLDRSAKRLLGGLQSAACLLCLRSGFFR